MAGLVAAVTVLVAVEAMEPPEAIGAVVPVYNMVEATVEAMLVITLLLRRIEEDGAEKNSYIGSSVTPCSKVELPILLQGVLVGPSITLCT